MQITRTRINKATLNFDKVTYVSYVVYRFLHGTLTGEVHFTRLCDSSLKFQVTLYPLVADNQLLTHNQSNDLEVR